VQPEKQIIFLSDCADTLQRLQENIAPGAEQVLDWFHRSMRLTVLRQMIKGAWKDEATIEAKNGLVGSHQVAPVAWQCAKGDRRSRISG
jgi:hypothetical protein